MAALRTSQGHRLHWLTTAALVLAGLLVCTGAASFAARGTGWWLDVVSVVCSTLATASLVGRSAWRVSRFVAPLAPRWAMVNAIAGAAVAAAAACYITFVTAVVVGFGLYFRF